MKKTFSLVAAALMSFSASSFAAFPEKDLTLIVPWSACGGTDTIARALVKNAKEHIGVNVNIVNKTWMAKALLVWEPLKWLAQTATLLV